MKTQKQLKEIATTLSFNKISKLIEKHNFGMKVSQPCLTRIANGQSPSSHNTTILVERTYKEWIKSQKKKE